MMTTAGLFTLQINWLRFLQIMFQDSGYEITENEKIAIFALEYLKKLSNITANTSERWVLENVIKITIPFDVTSRKLNVKAGNNVGYWHGLEKLCNSVVVGRERTGNNGASNSPPKLRYRRHHKGPLGSMANSCYYFIIIIIIIIIIFAREGGVLLRPTEDDK